MTFTLDTIRPANAEWKPQKILLYGVQGLGKTTFGATFESPILARTEDGAAAIDIPTFPELITDYYSLYEATQSLKGEHQFKTLVIDSLDWLEPIVWAYTCQQHEQENIESFGYGKGYVHALNYWRQLQGYFDDLRFHRGMDIVLIAHAEIKRFESPESESYDRYQIKLHNRASALWQEWADMVLFCNYQARVEKEKQGFNKEKARGTGQGERLIYTEERPAFLSKNRWGLPPSIYIGQDKTWSGFHQALNAATGGRYQIPNNQTQEVENAI